MNASKILPLISFLVAQALAAASAPGPEAFQVLKHGPQPGKQITPYLEYQMDRAWMQDKLRRATLEAAGSRDQFLQLQREIRRKLLEDIGGLPGEKSPLNARIVGTLQMDGYRIEKLIYESLPGFQVTAIVCVPDGPARPRPAVLLACGHAEEAKGAYYHTIASSLARRGYVTLCWDPVGQGERSQFWDTDRKNSRYNRVCGEHAVMGNLAYLVGANLARWEIWDGIRALDYLLTRPDVDSTRISVTGTSGGGFQSAHLGALDPRIKVVAPSCYISSLPMRMNNRIYTDPDSDPEQDLYRMVADGIDHPGLCLLVYPRPLIVCFAVEDFFPIEGARKTFREVADIYHRFGIPERVAKVEGYHPHQFSAHNREVAFAFLDRFNGLPVRYELDSAATLKPEQLWCTKSGQVLPEYGGRPLVELIKEYYLQRKGRISLKLTDLYHGDYYPGIAGWEVVPYQGVPAQDKIGWEKVGETRFEDAIIDRYILHHSEYLSLPLLHIHGPLKSGGPVLFWFSPRGKASPEDWPEIKGYLKAGYEVVSFDFRALGENRMLYSVVSVDDPALARVAFEKQYNSPISGVLANYVYNSLLEGRPYFLQMIEDAEIALRFVKDRLKASRVLVTSTGETYSLAFSVAEVLEGVELLPREGEKVLKWSEIVENMQESWPIWYLLPYGAYVR